MTADTFSNTLGFLIMGTGNDNNTWGSNANASVFQVFEDAIANALTNTVTGGTLDLSGSPPPAAASQVRYAALIFNGTITGAQTIKVPNLTKFWWVQNATAGAFALSIQTPSGAAVAIPQNSGWQLVQCDGANTITVSPFNSKQIQMPDGTVALPAYSNVNETKSGWYRNGTQDWRLSINGVDVLQVTGTGAGTPSIVNALTPNILQQNGVAVALNWVAGGGTGDAITATFAPAVTALTDGLLCFVRAPGANTLTNPTFSPNGLTAHTITKSGGAALIANDIPAALAEIILRYNLANTRWELLNPAPQNSNTMAPQGRLTPVSGTPVITSDAASATNIFFTPYNGNLCPIYNGAATIMQVFTEQTLALAAQHTANAIYDVFAFMNSGVFTIATGPAWATATAGAGARGSGAGTTQLAYQNGFLTNAVSIASARNGATTYSIAANQGTYLGSIFIDSVAGQVTCQLSYGQSRKWGIFNGHVQNRVPVQLKAGDPTTSWPYSTATIRPSNNSAANSLTIFSGLAEEEYDLRFFQEMSATCGSSALGGQSVANNGIGFNSTTAFSGSKGFVCSTTPGAVNIAFVGSPTAAYLAPPSLGINTVTALESGNPSGTGSSTSFFGTEAEMQLMARWRA